MPLHQQETAAGEVQLMGGGRVLGKLQTFPTRVCSLPFSLQALTLEIVTNGKDKNLGTSVSVREVGKKKKRIVDYRGVMWTLRTKLS